MGRQYPRAPILGVASVIFSGERVLMVKRNQEPGKGEWSLPGGVVELGEPHMEALRREVYEETSVRIEVGGLIGVFDRIVRDHEERILYHYVIVDYWGWMISGRVHARSDAYQAHLFAVGELDSLGLGKDMRGVIRAGADMLRRNRGSATRSDQNIVANGAMTNK